MLVHFLQLRVDQAEPFPEESQPFAFQMVDNFLQFLLALPDRIELSEPFLVVAVFTPEFVDDLEVSSLHFLQRSAFGSDHA